MPTIEYCLNNVSGSTRERLRTLDCAVEKRCLQRCGDCYRGSFLVVDGELETGPDHEAVLADAEVPDG